MTTFTFYIILYVSLFVCYFFIVIELGIAVVVTIVGFWFMWESSVIVTERNRLRRLTGEYYDIDISRVLRERNDLGE